MKRWLAVSLICGCSSQAPPAQDEMMFRFEGALTGARRITADGAPEGARVACVLQGDELVVSAVQNHGQRHGVGMYLRLSSFRGAGGYAFDAADRAWAFDDGHLQLCTRAGDRACYQGNTGCTLSLDRFELHDAGPDLPKGVRIGEAEGRFDCPALANATTGQIVGVRDGTFRCRAQDWTSAGR